MEKAPNVMISQGNGVTLASYSCETPMHFVSVAIDFPNSDAALGKQCCPTCKSIDPLHLPWMHLPWMHGGFVKKEKPIDKDRISKHTCKESCEFLR